MNIEYTFQLSPQDIFKLESDLAAEKAYNFKLYWSSLSKSPKKFYVRLADTVGSEDNVIVAYGTDAGLARYISEKRGIIDRYILEDRVISEGGATIKSYNL